MPGERDNDPLPDVKSDTGKTDAKTDVKVDGKGDIPGDGAVDGGTVDAGTDDAVDAGTGDAVDAGTDDADDATDGSIDVPALADGDASETIVILLGCKGNADCADLPTLPCQATPTCSAETGLCATAKLPAASPCSVDACLLGATCDAAGACLGGTPVNCDDANPCTADLCDGGVCKHASSAGNCDDGNACTVSDHCKDGACVLTPMSCDSSDPCLPRTCNPKTGDCNPSAKMPTLADKVPCSNPGPCQEALCSGGKCGGVDQCDDGNPCTNDVCTAAGSCGHDFIAGQCGSGGVCIPGVCTLVKDGSGVELASCVTKVACDDHNDCTLDTCLGPDPANTTKAKCSNASAGVAGAACTPSDPCFAEGACDSKKKCVGTTPKVCADDGNPCTDDACVALVGCSPTFNTKPCVDGNGCTVGDACAGGICTGANLSCDDGNACTVDACDTVSGCTHTPADDGASCGGAATCTSGICKAP